MTFKHTSLQTDLKRISIILMLIIWGVQSFAQTASWQVRPTYDSVRIISENLLMVEKNGHWGLCGNDGKPITGYSYDSITDFKDNYAILIEEGIAKGCVSTGGKVTYFDKDYLIDVNYPYYSEGVLAVKNNGKWGYIDTAGNTVLECRYRYALPFMNGLASVSDGEGHFMHINKTGRISLLGTGFNDDDLILATSFIKDDKGTAFAIIVNSKWKAYKRDLSGKRAGTFELAKVNVDTKKRTIESDGSILYFDNAWRLSHYELNGVRKKEYPANDSFTSAYQPASNALSAHKESNGLYGLKYNDTTCIPGQFEDAIVLDRVNVLASCNGLYGILGVNTDESVSLGFDNSDIILNHHIACKLTGSVNIPESLKGKYFEIQYVRSKDGLPLIPEQNVTSFNFGFLPEDLHNGNDQEFEISFKVDGIEYPALTRNIRFNHEFSFDVSAPAKVSLNENSSCQFYVYISNRSDQRSDICEIYVDDKLLKTVDSFSNGQQIPVTVSKSINMEDEDLKTRTLNIRIVEKGCPEYTVTKKVTFERYYANN